MPMSGVSPPISFMIRSRSGLPGTNAVFGSNGANAPERQNMFGSST